MRGTWQSEGAGPGELVAMAGGVAAVAVIIWLVLTFLWLIAAIVGVAVVLAVAGLVWLARHGGEVATVAHAALPPPEATPVTGRPARELPAPEFHLHLHGPLTREQLAEVAAMRENAVQAFDTYRREP